MGYVEEVVSRALSQALLYGFPIEFKVSGSVVTIRYKGRGVQYVVLELRDLSGKPSGVGLAVPGLEQFHVKIAELGEDGAKVLWEELPKAIALDKKFMGWGETDLWIIRFKLRGQLREAKDPPEPLRELLGLGLKAYTSPEQLEYAVGSEGVIGLWYTPMTSRVDFAMEIQERMGLFRWGEALRGAREWVERVEQSRWL
ncbi:MAG: hypothetical protein N3F67_05170 [Acidilobaceae archaeon]|nr:hypothetical protein [Acidilobaceae archaeon]